MRLAAQQQGQQRGKRKGRRHHVAVHSDTEGDGILALHDQSLNQSGENLNPAVGVFFRMILGLVVRSPEYEAQRAGQRIHEKSQE
ncbi:MAG: hypothetical protein Tsb0026_01510 [Sulfuricaulis sp.]